MMTIDLNCDLGEGMDTDEQIIPLISSANIACGFHAGNEKIMEQTIALCLQHKVAIGAHPSWPGKENFGRTEMQMDEAELYNIVTEQLYQLTNIASKQGAIVRHVKPHGALYNQSAKDKSIAATIAKAVKDVNPQLILFGLSGGLSISEAKKINLKTASEVFADRTYNEDGSLTSRLLPNAMIHDEAAAIKQALQMIKEKTVTSVSGKIIPVTADTICIHGDGPTALPFAKAISTSLQQLNIVIKAVS
jgi:5-oxoprolinase (ATP-hydrolysing) subunit A